VHHVATASGRVGSLPLDGAHDWAKIVQVRIVELYLKIDKACLLARGLTDPSLAVRPSSSEALDASSTFRSRISRTSSTRHAAT
jgi:hypothetical protein